MTVKALCRSASRAANRKERAAKAQTLGERTLCNSSMAPSATHSTMLISSKGPSSENSGMKISGRRLAASRARYPA